MMPDSSAKIDDNKLTIRIDGPYFPFDKFIKAIESFDSILKEIDKETSEDGQQTVAWSIESLSKGSLVVTAQGAPCKENVDYQRASEIVNSFAKGLESLRRNPERPSDFSRVAMKNARALAELLNPDDFAELYFSAKGWKFGQMDEVADNLLQETRKNYKSWGSVVGKMISLNNEKKTRFGIRVKQQGKAINCFLDEEELFKIALEAIKTKQNVYVYGEIRQVWNGRKVNIKAREIRLLDDHSDESSPSSILERIRAIRSPGV